MIPDIDLNGACRAPQKFTEAETTEFSYGGNAVLHLFA